MNIREQMKSDEGVSPVIAVILMVAITVVLAATVYVWVSGFAADQEGPEQASATATGLDTNDNGDVDVVRVMLTAGENAPYSLTCDPTDCSAGYDSDTDFRVVGTDGAGSAFDASNLFSDSSITTSWANGDEWDVGEAIYLNCAADGVVDISVSVKGTAILDTTIDCDEAA